MDPKLRLGKDTQVEDKNQKREDAFHEEVDKLIESLKKQGDALRAKVEELKSKP